jgi:hypothetical protein
MEDSSDIGHFHQPVCVFVHRFEASEVDKPACGGAAMLVGGRRVHFHPASREPVSRSRFGDPEPSFLTH